MVAGTEAPDEEDRVWRELASEFATWRFFLPRPRDFYVACTRLGSDFSRGTLKLTYWRRGIALLQSQTRACRERLRARAIMNARQAENYLRFMFYLFLSIPIALSLATAQLFPALWSRLMEGSEGSWFAVIGIWAAVVLVFYASSWKARELENCISYAAARLDGAPMGGAADAEDEELVVPEA